MPPKDKRVTPDAQPAPSPEERLALIQAAIAGERAAFGRLFALYAPMVHGLLLARVSPAEADDLLQDVFLHAMEKLHTLQKPQNFGAWLASIARNRATDFHRSHRKMEELPETLAQQAPDRLDALRALAVIRTLPEAYRETLILRLVEGMTGPEIAEQVGLTPESVRVNLHRGMQQLRERLGIVRK